MPNIAGVLARFTDDTILYWQKTGDNNSGIPAYAEPVPISVRWEAKQKEIVTPQGRQVLTKAYLISGTELVPGSLVYLGPTIPHSAANVRLDWEKTASYPALPTVNEGGLEVLICNRTPGIRRGFPGNVFEVYA
jgi:hypothetical protein